MEEEAEEDEDVEEAEGSDEVEPVPVVVVLSLGFRVVVLPLVGSVGSSPITRPCFVVVVAAGPFSVVTSTS